MYSGLLFIAIYQPIKFQDNILQEYGYTLQTKVFWTDGPKDGWRPFPHTALTFQQGVIKSVYYSSTQSFFSIWLTWKYRDSRSSQVILCYTPISKGAILTENNLLPHGANSFLYEKSTFWKGPLAITWYKIFPSPKNLHVIPL